MTGPGGHPRDGRPGTPAGVLADRIAAALIHHEPGWRLPRMTALARRYSVSAAEVDTAIEELAGRQLLRRLPDGQVYRASPAEYQVHLEGLAGLSSCVDPMGGVLTCRSRQVSTGRAPEDVSRALALAADGTVLSVRCLWLVGGEPGALSTTYLPQQFAGLAAESGGLPPADAGEEANGMPPPGGGAPGERTAGWPADTAGQAAGGTPATGEQPAGSRAHVPVAGRARAVQVELGPPPPSVARSLRLAPGQPVATVTARFEDPAATPVALTVAMLRPDLFRIVVRAGDDDQPAGDASVPAWRPAG